MFFAGTQESVERDGVLAHLRVNQQRNVRVQIAQRIKRGKRHVHQITHAAHVHQHLVGALISERSAKLCNHPVRTRWRLWRRAGGVSTRPRGISMRALPPTSNVGRLCLSSVLICVYLWIRSMESLAVQIDGIDHADDGGVDRRIGPTDSGHGGKSFVGDEHALADAGADGVEREDRVAAVGAIEIERLDDENFAALVRSHFLRCHNVADDAADQHGKQSRVGNRKLEAKTFLTEECPQENHCNLKFEISDLR